MYNDLNSNSNSNSNSIFYSTAAEYFIPAENNGNVEERGSAIGSVWTGNGELSLLGGDDFSFL